MEMERRCDDAAKVIGLVALRENQSVMGIQS